MVKRPAKPKACSHCGSLLTAVALCEIIPASYYYFSDKKYLEGEIPEGIPDLTTEFRCAHCNSKIEQTDLDYVVQRMIMKRDEDGQGQITTQRNQESPKE